MNLIETSGYCPFCGEPLTFLIDPFPEQQEYVEDCQVCCCPILVSVVLEDGNVLSLDTRQENY